MSPKYKDCKKIKQFNVKRVKTSWRGRSRLFAFLLVILLIIGVGYYLVLINNQATMGYRLADLSKRVDSLREANDRLEIKKIELEQISRIEKAALALNMQPAENVAYLADKGEVAVR